MLISIKIGIFFRKMANERKSSEQELDDELETSSKKDVNSVEKFSDVITLQKNDSEALPPPHPLPQNIGEGTIKYYYNSYF